MGDHDEFTHIIYSFPVPDSYTKFFYNTMKVTFALCIMFGATLAQDITDSIRGNPLTEASATQMSSEPVVEQEISIQDVLARTWWIPVVGIAVFILGMACGAHWFFTAERKKEIPLPIRVRLEA